MKNLIYELLENFIYEKNGIDIDADSIDISDELMKDWDFSEEDVEEFYEVLNEEFGTDLSFPETDDKLSTIIEAIKEELE